MRATWFTSLLAGIVFGAVTGLDEAEFSTWYGLALLLILVPVAVLGLPQLREAFTAGKQREGISTPRMDDIRRHFIPAWGRLIVWLASAAAAAWVERMLGW